MAQWVKHNPHNLDHARTHEKSKKNNTLNLQSQKSYLETSGKAGEAEESLWAS